VNARTRVLELFTLESIVEQYQSLYESVITQEQPGEMSVVDPADVAGSWNTSLIQGPDNI
ncbi:MAG: hypothetical protein DMF69_18985, partial [Acidobacteria bacterium]